MLFIRSQTREQAVALMEWRDAAELVSSRWRTYLDAEPEQRAFAFASYLSALNAEEAAAVDMVAIATQMAAEARCDMPFFVTLLHAPVIIVAVTAAVLAPSSILGRLLRTGRIRQPEPRVPVHGSANATSSAPGA